MAAPTRQLPIFPLHTVLFPGGLLPLHIFEPRYQAMTRACLAGDERFGVALIAEGPEVGGPARPHAVGTIARIASVEALAGGRFNLMTVGQQRFAIERTWLEPAGYLAGQVRLLDDRNDAAPAELAALVTELRVALIDYVGRLSPEPVALQGELARVDDPLRLGGLAASLLRGATGPKQQVLEIDSLPERLRRLLALLRREFGLLDLLKQTPPTKLTRGIISPN